MMTPSAKRFALAPPSRALADEETGRLQKQVESLQRQLEEQQQAADEAAKLSALDLLREKQRCQEVEVHRDFVSRSEERLKQQLTDARKRVDEEHAARLEELRRRVSAEEAEAACDELRAANAAERDADRATIQALQAELTQLSGRQDSSNQSTASSGSSPALVAALKREAATAKSEAESLAQRLAASERKLATRSDLEEHLAAAHAEIARLKDKSTTTNGVSSSGAAPAAQAGSVGDYALAADLGELRRQLAESDEQRETFARLNERHKKLDAQVQSWCVLFAAELSGDPAVATLTADGLPPAGSAERVKAKLDRMKVDARSAEAKVAALQSSEQSARTGAATAQRQVAEAKAEAEAAKSALAAAEASGKRAEWQVTELSVARGAQDDYIRILEADREARKPGVAGRKADTSGDRGGKAAATDGSDACLLRTQLDAAVARCEQLSTQNTELSAAATAASDAARAAKLEVAAAKEASANATALSRSASLSNPSGTNPTLSNPSGTNPTPASLGAGSELPPGTKVLHLAANPAQNAQQALIDGLRARVRALRMQLDVAEAGHATAALASTPAASEGGGGGALAAATSAASLLEAQSESEELRKQVKDLTTQRERLKTVFQSKIREFRDKVMLLTGYRVDMPQAGEHLYNLYPPYLPPTAQTCLTFRSDEAGNMQILATDMTTSVPDCVESYLKERNSLPAFLAGVTLKLFNDHCE